MVAFGFLPQNFWKWQGPTNGTLSFYECRFSGGDTIKWGRGGTQTLPYAKKLFELFGCKCLCPGESGSAISLA